MSYLATHIQPDVLKTVKLAAMLKINLNDFKKEDFFVAVPKPLPKAAVKVEKIVPKGTAVPKVAPVTVGANADKPKAIAPFIFIKKFLTPCLNSFKYFSKLNQFFIYD